MRWGRLATPGMSLHCPHAALDECQRSYCAEDLVVCHELRRGALDSCFARSGWSVVAVDDVPGIPPVAAVCPEHRCREIIERFEEAARVSSASKRLRSRCGQAASS